MKSKQKLRLKKQLYVAYSLNLKDLFERERKLFPDGPEIPSFPLVVCPLCSRVMRWEDCDGENSLVSLEHNPPKQYGGGKPQIITCRPCNNMIGGQSEPKLGEDLDRYDFISGRPHSSVNTDFFIGDIRIKGVITHQADGKTLKETFPKVDAYREAALTHALKENPKSIVKKMSAPQWDHSHLVQLKIAHLMMFQRFGYSYLLSEGGIAVMRSLYHKVPLMHEFGAYRAEVSNNGTGIFYCINNRGNQAMSVVYDLVTKRRTHRTGVLIPGYGTEALIDYLSIEQSLSDSLKMRVAPIRNQGLPERRLNPIEFAQFWINATRLKTKHSIEELFTDQPLVKSPTPQILPKT